MTTCEQPYHQHNGYTVLHDITNDCCLCCNVTPRSVDIYDLDKYWKKGYLLDDEYKKVLNDINNFYDQPYGNRKNILYRHPTLLNIYYAELQKGRFTVKYSS